MVTVLRPDLSWAEDATSEEDAQLATLHVSVNEMRMFGFVRRLMKGPSISTRLSENDALEIALNAAQREGLMDAVLVPELRTVGERVVWIIGSTERGLSWWVEVDDATGKASPIHYPPAV